LVLGADLLGWFDQSPPVEPGQFPVRIAWTGQSSGPKGKSAGLRLFDIVWQNPRPEAVIESLDFVAKDGCPFLTAITVEP